MTTEGNNVIQLEDHASPEERASRWIARIDAGPLTPEERQELREWIASHPDNADLLDAQALLWSNASRARFPRAKTLHKRAKRSAWSELMTRPRVAVAGGLLAAAFFVVGGVVRLGGDAETGHYTTLIGKTSQVELKDGSSIHLNTASSTKVDYTEHRRVIILERGEGFFEVSKDKNRPFDVVAGDTVVRAVGTKFSVRRLESGKVEVAVTEGVVELLRKADLERKGEQRFSKPVRLAQGQSGVQSASTLLVTQKDEKAMVTRLSWLQGRLTFDSERLVDAVEQVNRYSQERVVLGDASLADLKVSGSFKIEDVPVFLNSLERGFGLEVTHADGVATISKRAS